MIKTIDSSSTIMTIGRQGSWLLVNWPSLQLFVNRHDDRSLTITIVRRQSRCSLDDSDVQTCRSPAIMMIDLQRSRRLIIDYQDDSKATMKMIRSQRSRQLIVMTVDQSRSVINGWSWSHTIFVVNGHQYLLIKGLNEFFSKTYGIQLKKNIFQTHNLIS